MQTNTENKKKSEQKSVDFESSQLTKWLIKIKWMLVFACIVFIGIIAWYWFNFGKGNEFSTKPEDWGTFGDYVGGVLNPFFSFLALIALLLTINIQTLQLKKSEEDTIKQAEHLEREFKRIDYHRLIEKLAERINENYKGHKLDSPETKLTSLFEALSKNNQNITNHNIKIKIISEEYENVGSSIFNTIWMIENDLSRLYMYIKKYELLSQYDESPLQDFYKAEFEDLITALFTYEWIANTDNKEIFHEFIFTN